MLRDRIKNGFRVVEEEEKLAYPKPDCARVYPPNDSLTSYPVAPNGAWGRVYGLTYIVPDDFRFESQPKTVWEHIESISPEPKFPIRSWVNCPVCNEPDMRKEVVDDEGHSLIFCTNHACPSNQEPQSSEECLSKSEYAHGVMLMQYLCRDLSIHQESATECLMNLHKLEEFYKWPVAERFLKEYKSNGYK